MNSNSPEDAQAQALCAALRAGNRRALAKAITLVESRRAADEKVAEALVNAALPHSGKALRIGLTGAPGAGKSTFIEAFGTWLTEQGRRVAVFAVDPSSRRSGGSILGDKTRMVHLSRNPNAFIRPSPAGDTQGGVARRTREAMVLAEAAGFEITIVETVGAGQSETAVADMTDVFVVLVAPGSGDELQGIKRGMMELADIVVVTKADGDMLAAANRTAADFRAALHLLKPKFAGWSSEVRMVSSVAGVGTAEVWQDIEAFQAAAEKAGALKARRREQLMAWLRRELEERLLAELAADAGAAQEMARIEGAVQSGEVTPAQAAKAILTRRRGQS